MQFEKKPSEEIIDLTKKPQKSTEKIKVEYKRDELLSGLPNIKDILITHKSLMNEGEELEKLSISGVIDNKLANKINIWVNDMIININELAFGASFDIYKSLNLTKFMKITTFVKMLKIIMAGTIITIVGIPLLIAMLEDLIKTIKDAQKNKQ